MLRNFASISQKIGQDTELNFEFLKKIVIFLVYVLNFMDKLYKNDIIVDSLMCKREIYEKKK